MSPLGTLYLYIKMYSVVADSHNAHGPGWISESSDTTWEEYIADGVSKSRIKSKNRCMMKKDKEMKRGQSERTLR